MIKINSNKWPMIIIRKSLVDNTYTVIGHVSHPKVSFRICKLTRKKKWYDNIRNYFNRWFSLANR